MKQIKSICRLYWTPISILLVGCFLSPGALAQSTDSVKVVKVIVVNDSLKKPKKPFLQAPRAVRVGVNLFPPISTVLGSDFREYEVNGELLFGNKYILAGDFGISDIERGDVTNYTYEGQGTYLRIGLDYNNWFEDKTQTEAMLTIGFRYGLAFFQHALRYEGAATYWDPAFQGNLEESSLTANWLEVGGSLRVKLFDNLFIGPAAYITFILGTKETEELAINAIPAYGLNNNLRMRLGYHVLYQINWKKK